MALNLGFLYFMAKKITDAKVKRAELLLLRGTEIQDLYYCLPLVTDLPTGQDEFTYTIAQLTSKIAPASNKWYKRYVLAQLRQKPDESISSFTTRIRKQVKLCSFDVNFAGTRSTNHRMPFSGPSNGTPQRERKGIAPTILK